MKTLAWILAALAALFVAGLAALALYATGHIQREENRKRIAPAAAKRWAPREPDTEQQQQEKAETVHVDMKDGMKVNSVQDEKVN